MTWLFDNENFFQATWSSLLWTGRQCHHLLLISPLSRHLPNTFPFLRPSLLHVFHTKIQERVNFKYRHSTNVLAEMAAKLLCDPAVVILKFYENEFAQTFFVRFPLLFCSASAFCLSWCMLISYQRVQYLKHEGFLHSFILFCFSIHMTN